MKRAILFIIVLLAATAAQAQEMTLFNNNQWELGGFGGPSIMYTRFNHEPALLVGGQGAFLGGHLFYLGLSGYCLATEHAGPGAMVNGALQDSRFEGGYGGLMLGMIIQNNSLLHASADVTIGGGTLVNTLEDRDDEWDFDSDNYPSDGYFMLQPMLHAEVNLTEWMRADLGAGWRFVDGVTQFGLNDDDVSGVVAGVTFRFGQF
ncbi:MAG: hypothetical protein C4524_03400 [Candidatus Zixiibacteriota bacterium]|nr:MAG: hypothetical protein C4524_03400 [candidate division Zixibacteria bacterium]